MFGIVRIICIKILIKYSFDHRFVIVGHMNLPGQYILANASEYYVVDKYVLRFHVPIKNKNIC